MKIAGIVAEYNPFHKGHQYQTKVLREKGYDGIIAAMSGNFVQRADVAITDKYRRAEAAVRGGVDLVIELPLPYAIASAEDFALGGIKILTSTGIIDTICCGCESSEEENRIQYERLCKAEEDGLIKEKMMQGRSYPAACREAFSENGMAWSEEPNDVLALAYRKALARTAPHIPLLTLKRKGSFYGGPGKGFESAQSIRSRFIAGEDVTLSLPKSSHEMLEECPIADLKRLERAILVYYRTASPQELKQYYAMREGLADRICKAKGARSLNELYDQVKTKRFPHSAVRRAILCGYLKIPAKLPEISYLRVLAFNERGQTLLRKMKKKAALPVVPRLTQKMLRDDHFSSMTKVQLYGDEIFALTLSEPEVPLRDLTKSSQKVILK